jgi:hypothetical protein
MPELHPTFPGKTLRGAVTGDEYRVMNFHSDGPWLFRKHPDGQWVSLKKLDLSGIIELIEAVASGAWLPVGV